MPLTGAINLTFWVVQDFQFQFALLTIQSKETDKQTISSRTQIILMEGKHKQAHMFTCGILMRTVGKSINSFISE